MARACHEVGRTICLVFVALWFALLVVAGNADAMSGGLGRVGAAATTSASDGYDALPSLTQAYYRGVPRRTVGSASFEALQPSSIRETTPAIAAKGGDDLVDVWRAVGPDEAADIAVSQASKPGPGQIGKYFYPTREQAENLAANYTKRGIGAPYTLTSGKVPRSDFDGVDAIHPAGEGPAWFFANEVLPSICRVICHGPVG